MLFPIANDTETFPRTNSITTVVGSPVLAATVGPGLNFVRLAEPVRILLRLNEELDLRVGRYNVVCVSFDVTYKSSVRVILTPRHTHQLYIASNAKSRVGDLLFSQ